MIKRIMLSLFLLTIVALPQLGTQASYQPTVSPIEKSNPANSQGSSQSVLFPLVQNTLTTGNDISQACHFGLALVPPWTAFDLSTLGIGNYEDWGVKRSSTVPSNIDYIRVLNVSDKSFLRVRASLPTLLANNPGAFWIIGNEPDSEVTYQDHISPEIYGERFYDLATIIRRVDPTARIGFGPVIQPTPIRMYYLTLALNRMTQLAGGVQQAHALFDVYTIHAYILNEAQLYDSTGKVISWGAGLPTGYNPATWPATEQIHPELGQTWMIYDINTFKSRLIDFRQWMKNQGDQNKPLYITEYGVLFPPIGNPYLYASDTDTANFMAQTYDLMLGYKDPSIGYPADDNRLVQKWTWFSLNNPRTVFGGTLYDPANGTSTPIGDRFAQYDPPLSAVPVTNPTVYVIPNSLKAAPLSKSTVPGLVNYMVSFRISNFVSSDRRTGITVNLYEGSTLIGSVVTEIPRCSGQVQAGFLMRDLQPGQTYTFTAHIALQPGNGIDTNSAANNQVSFPPLTMPNLTTLPYPTIYIPKIQH